MILKHELMVLRAIKVDNGTLLFIVATRLQRKPCHDPRDLRRRLPNQHRYGVSRRRRETHLQSLHRLHGALRNLQAATRRRDDPLVFQDFAERYSLCGVFFEHALHEIQCVWAYGTPFFGGKIDRAVSIEWKRRWMDGYKVNSKISRVSLPW